ncbi:MAG: ABC transporter ATP-binding protein, partial [Limisphaerales bacterium]
MAQHLPLSSHNDPTFAAKSRSTWEVIRRVAVYLKPYQWMAFGTVACAVLSLLMGFVYPLLTKYIIDDVIGQKRIDRLTPIMLALLGAFLLRELFNSLRIRINNTFEQNVIYDMRREVYGRLQRLPVNYFDQRASGDLMTRIIEDVNSVERLLIDGTEQGTVAILSIVGVLAMVFYKNSALAWAALMPAPLLLGGALWYTLTAHRRYRAQRHASSAMNALLMDNLQGVRQIKSFGRENHEDARFAQRADELRRGTLGVMRVWANYSPAMTFAASLGLGLVFWIGGKMVIADKMTIGQLIEFIFYLALFYEPIRGLHGLNQMLQAARAAGERVFDILDTKIERADSARKQNFNTAVRGEVVYENVGFAYSADKIVLRNISLRAQPGQMIALAGPTGAGKSTLVNLLPAFYEISSGKITIDGLDLKTLSLESLRSQ